MAWDPFNVTEDADLGMRLAAQGLSLRDARLDHLRGGADAPHVLAPQRTRWMKGYMQTWLVHMRSPRALWRELGPHGFLAFQIMVGGTLLLGTGASLVLRARGV